jgi:hypothetical protein
LRILEKMSKDTDEAEEELVWFPSSVLEMYNVWVDEWSDNWKREVEGPQDYRGPVFSDRTEEVAWNVAGYMLAWGILLAPGVGSVVYTAGSTDYLLERGNGLATERFLGDQIELLAMGAKGLP